MTPIHGRRLRILIKLSWRLMRFRLSDRHSEQESKRLLYDSFKELGGVYVKFLQILVVDADFLRGWSGPAEFEIFESVTFEEIDLAALLQAELPGYQQHFASIEAVPFAAGSFAQVYRGRLHDGKEVIIKVLRPSLIKNLQSDLRLLGIIANVASRLVRNSTIDIRQIYRQFRATVQNEVNYEHEIKNAAWFYRYFAKSPDIVIPKTYTKLSGRHVIVQEMIGGLSIAEVLTAQSEDHDPVRFVKERLGSDVWTQLETVGTEILVSIFTADFVIGDPHPGNIKLLPENKIGLIDFGIAAAAPANRYGFLNLMREYEKMYAGNFDVSSFTVTALRLFDDELVQSLQVAGKLLTPQEPHLMLRKIGEAASRALEEAKNDPQVATMLDQRIVMRLFAQTINEQNRFGIAINTDTSDIIKTMITFLEVIRSTGKYSQNFDVIYRSLHRAITVADNSQLPPSHTKPKPGTDEALEFLSAWLSRLADKDPFLYRQVMREAGL